MSDHLEVLEVMRILPELDTTERNGFAGHGQFFLHLAIAHERYREGVVAVLNLEHKLTFLVRHGSGQQVLALHDTYVGELDRLLRAGIDDLTGHLRRKQTYRER